MITTHKLLRNLILTFRIFCRIFRLTKCFEKSKCKKNFKIFKGEILEWKIQNICEIISALCDGKVVKSCKKHDKESN